MISASVFHGGIVVSLADTIGIPTFTVRVGTCTACYYGINCLNHDEADFVPLIVYCLYKASFTMLNKELNVQECDATMFNSCSIAGPINSILK